MQIENYLLAVSFSKYSNRTKQVIIGDWPGFNTNISSFYYHCKNNKVEDDYFTVFIVASYKTIIVL